MTFVIAGSVGMVLGGVPGSFVGLCCVLFRRKLPLRRREPALRPVLLVLMVELRSGSSVLRSLQDVSRQFPEHEHLALAVRIGTVAGLTRAVTVSSGPVKNLMSQLARSQVSGSSAANAVLDLIESDLARERSSRLARTRSLPVRLMIPMTLLILPGVVLSAYGTTLLSLLDDLTQPFT